MNKRPMTLQRCMTKSQIELVVHCLFIYSSWELNLHIRRRSFANVLCLYTYVRLTKHIKYKKLKYYFPIYYIYIFFLIIGTLYFYA